MAATTMGTTTTHLTAAEIELLVLVRDRDGWDRLRSMAAAIFDAVELGRSWGIDADVLLSNLVGAGTTSGGGRRRVPVRRALTRLVVEGMEGRAATFGLWWPCCCGGGCEATVVAVDCSGNPIVGASVTIDVPGGPYSGTTTTGGCTSPIDIGTAGTYTTTVSATGYQTYTGPLTYPCPANLTVTLLATGATPCQITVYGCNGCLLTGATVTVNGQTYTTSVGVASFTLPGPGSYPYTVNATRFATYSGTFTVTSVCSGCSTTVTLTPATGYVCPTSIIGGTPGHASAATGPIPGRRPSS